MYDVIIIGAGIGGLVCGCYLAKGGLKVLIAEQHHKPGGYCTSFSRQGFSFDAAAHSFGGYREEGLVRQVFSELSVDKKIIIKRYEPSDVIKTPEFTFSYWSDLSKTLDELVNIFPKEERNISEREQDPLHVHGAGIPPERVLVPDHAVTGDHERQRVVRHRLPHGSRDASGSRVFKETR